MEPLSNHDDVLPRLSEIPETTLGFLKAIKSLNAIEDLSKLEDLATELSTKCSLLETHIKNLHTRLSSLLVSWVSSSVRAKTCLEDVTFNLESLCLVTSQYGSRTQGGRRMQKIVTKDLPYIATELRRIESIREYAVTALKLEALVGDLEDAAFSTLNQRTGNVFSRTSPGLAIPGDVYAKLDDVNRAVKAINKIEELLLYVLKLHPHWGKLLKAADTRVDKILGVLRPQVIADHRNLLVSLGWPPKLSTSNMQNGEATSIPNPLVLMQGEKLKSYSQSFLALSALQHVQSHREERHNFLLGNKNEETVGLWAIDELVGPIAARIEHHLLKWIDQPEFMFVLVYKITWDFIQGVDDVLQPLIDRARLVSCSAKEAWMSAMVQVLCNFLAKRVFPVLATRYRDKATKSDAISSWLHLIDHTVRFDKRMQSLVSSETSLFWGEDGSHVGVLRSMTVLSLFCERPDWLHIWAKVELKDASAKLKEELKDERAWSTEKSPKTESDPYFLSTKEDHKAPTVVEFALKIAWEMIQRCRTLPGTSCRIQFIRSAPAKFLWHFFKVLLSRHKNTEFSHDSDQTLARICQLINAARYSEFKLQEWSDDVGFLELTLAEKGDATSSSCFFEEEIESLVEMQTNWLMEVITRVLRDFENLSCYYIHDVDCFERAPSDRDLVDQMDVVVSDDLAEALDNLRSQLLLIKEHLNANDFLDIWRNLADGLDRFTFRSILSAGIRFSDGGVKQFLADMQGLLLVFQGFCARPEAFFPCIRDFIKLSKLGRGEVVDLKSKLLDNAKGTDCLLSLGISNLSVDQAMAILNNRKLLW